jgi:integrase
MTTPKKIRESTGGAYEKRGAFFMRITTAPQKRTAEHLPWCTSLEAADARAKVVQAWVNRLRQAGQVDFIETTVELGAKAEDEKKLAKIGERITAFVGNDFDREPPQKRVGEALTFEEVGTKFTSGELHRLHPDHVADKRTIKDDEYRLALLNEIPLASGPWRKLGDVPMVDFSLDHADEAMRQLDSMRAARTGRSTRRLEPASRRQYAQILHRLCSLAAYPMRIIRASPLPSGWMPSASNNKAKGLLYPDEEAQTMACTKHDLSWRVFFGFLARSGLRADEGAGLRISDVDLARGVVTLDENKTDDPRAPTYGPEVMIALRLWRERYRRDAKPADLFFVRPDGARIPIDGLADFYRNDFVKDAGVDRAELFVRSKSRIPLRVHDLRGFFITYALAGGRTETWVMDRTGHKSSVMVNRYRRVARTVAEAGLGSPVPLHLAIPELAAAFTAANAAATTKKGLPKRGASDSNSKSSGPIAQSVELRTFNP